MTDQPAITLDIERKSESRKGWVSKSRLPRFLQLPDGRTIRVLGYEDIDEWERQWAESKGTTPEPETHVEQVHRGSNGQNTPTSHPGEAEAMAFIRDYTGTFGLILDLRADSRFGSKWFRLSERQIEVVLASKRRDEEWAARRQQQERPAVEPITHGMYRKDDVIYKVQKAVHGSGKLYAKVLVVDGPGQGHFEYAPGAVTTLRIEHRMSPEEAAEFGRLYGICIVCGATLTDERSIEAGIGPICRGKV